MPYCVDHSMPIPMLGYGLTETSPVATLTPGDNVVIGSVGQVVSNSEIKVWFLINQND